MSEVMINAMIIEEQDTVAVAIEPITAGTVATWRDKSGAYQSLTVVQDIPIYHKFAKVDMPKGTWVVKYGEHIGLAGEDIKVGQHVHVHNVESRREDL